jgi:hypothetical protein
MRHIPAGIALVLALSSCSTIPPAPARVPAIPEVLMREIGSLLDAGTFLQALQGISSLRLDPGQVTTADIDALETRATAALRDAFAASVKDKKYADALRYYRSATAYGRRDLTPGWTEKSLSAAQASELEIAGEKTLALILRLRGLSADSSEDELRSILKLAGEAGDVHAAAYIAQEMKKRGFAAPVAAAPEGKINFTNLIKGTVTIWVNRGITAEGIC